MEQIETCVSFLFGKAYQHIMAATKERLAPYGVTPVQFALLHVLWGQDGQSSAALGARLQLDSATMTGVLDRLAHAGALERRPDAADRRINRIFLTAQGRALQAPLNAVMDGLNADLFGQFAAADAERLRAMVAQLGRVAAPPAATGPDAPAPTPDTD
ncbi:MAG TPA: MarR family transcriptional regulator [Herpetosiphonaceae bacterium]